MTLVQIAANRGDVGGGEVMLLRIAGGLRDLGYAVRVIAPAQPDEVAVQAEAAGFDVVRIPCRDRRSYAAGLRSWDRQRQGLLWCNGLLPAVATAGRPGRLVHLHQLPAGWQRLAFGAARPRAVAVVVPSEYLRGALGGDPQVLSNWTDDPGQRARPAPPAGGSVTIGFLGRIGRAKGVDVLAQACGRLEAGLRSRVELLVAGDDRFVPPGEQAVVDAALADSGVTVRRPGWVSREDFYASVDVAVFPSVWEEVFGLVVVEAMAAGCPVVVSDAGAIPEVIGRDYPWIARRANAASLATVITEAVAALPADALTTRMRQRWEQQFSAAAGRQRLAALMAGLESRGVIDAPGRAAAP